MGIDEGARRVGGIDPPTTTGTEAASTWPTARSVRWTLMVTFAVWAMLVAIAACTRDVELVSQLRPPTGGDIRLVRADSCDDLVAASRARAEATAAARRQQEEVLPTTTVWDEGLVAGSADAAAGAPEAGTSVAGSSPIPTTVPGGSDGNPARPGTVIAGTNNQEQGVDEGDLAKTDGRRLVTLTTDGVLRVVVLDDTPAVDGTVSVADEPSRQGDVEHPASGQLGQLLLRGDEAVAVRDANDPEHGSTVEITRVDLSDPSAPRIIERSRVLGELAATRMVDTTVRVVIRPDVDRVAPNGPATTEPGASNAAVSDAAARLLPRRLTAGGDERPLGGCTDVLTPPATSPIVDEKAEEFGPGPSGNGAVTVLTVGATLDDLHPVTVEGNVESVYAATGALYTTATVAGATESATVVHRFDLTSAGAARYTGSALVPGHLLDQYSLSDRGGALRVVTTTTADEPGDVEFGCFERDGGTICVDPGEGVSGSSSSTAGRLTVLRPAGSGTLREVGHLDDLGRGEDVKSVRFLGDRAYVVTFRQTDPLFAIDLSEDSPRLLGELQLPGFSEYLHPIGDGRLLGIGSDADPVTGRVTGFKATLFDVSDPTAPRELDSLTDDAVRSTVGDDPHAFTWDPVRSQAIVPVESTQRWTPIEEPCVPDGPCMMPPPSVPPTTGGSAPEIPAASAAPAAMWVLGVDGDHIVRRGTIEHDRTGTVVPILRSVVVDDTIWTVSDVAVGHTSATTPDGATLIRY